MEIGIVAHMGAGKTTLLQQFEEIRTGRGIVIVDSSNPFAKEPLMFQNPYTDLPAILATKPTPNNRAERRKAARAVKRK